MSSTELTNALIQVADAIDSGNTDELRSMIERMRPPVSIPNMNVATIKYLREVTGLGMMQCKKALVSAQGDADDALRILRSTPPY